MEQAGEIVFGLLQRDDLCLGQHQAFLGALGLERLEPLVHGLRREMLRLSLSADGPSLP
jgi:hypothetical protein